MAEYYAVSATQQVEYYNRIGERLYGMDWYILAGPCSSRDEAEKQGKAKIGPLFDENGNDYNSLYSYAETLHKNLAIVAKSQLRHYRIELEKTWGGARKGAGRPRKMLKSSKPHASIQN